MIDTEKPPLEAVYLAHFGIKGMKWGVRKSNNASDSSDKKGSVSKLSPQHKARFKKVAIGFGVLLAAGGAIYVTRALNKGGSAPVSTIKSREAARKAAMKTFQEPTTILHSARGKDAGFQFLKTGGTPTPFEAWQRAGFKADGGGDRFERLADGKIAASFKDPLGRMDRAGRVIPHDVIIPKSMTSGVNSLDDVRSKIWPSLKPAHDVMYEAPANWRPGQGG